MDQNQTKFRFSKQNRFRTHLSPQWLGLCYRWCDLCMCSLAGTTVIGGPWRTYVVPSSLMMRLSRTPSLVGVFLLIYSLPSRFSREGAVRPCECAWFTFGWVAAAAEFQSYTVNDGASMGWKYCWVGCRWREIFYQHARRSCRWRCNHEDPHSGPCAWTI